MRRMYAVLLVLVLVASLAGCGEKKTERSLYDHGLDLIALMVEMAESDPYFTLYTASPELKEVVAPVKEGDYTQPKAVYQITIAEDMIAVLGEVESMEGISQPLKSYITSRTYGAVPSQINAAAGAQVLAASTVCTAGKTFVSSELTGSTLYLYTFETGVPAMVSFTSGEDSTVSATGCFILNEKFDAATPAAVEEFFQEMQAKVTLVEG